MMRKRKGLAGWTCGAALAVLASGAGCASGDVAGGDAQDSGVFDDVSDDIAVIDAGVTDATDGGDPDSDARPDGDTGLDTDGGDTAADVDASTADTDPDAVDADVVTPPMPGFVAQTSGGLVVVRDDIRVQIGVGAPQPVIRISNERIQLSIGPVPR